jgi:hypothetical protein
MFLTEDNTIRQVTPALTPQEKQLVLTRLESAKIPYVRILLQVLAAAGVVTGAVWFVPYVWRYLHLLTFGGSALEQQEHLAVILALVAKACLTTVVALFAIAVHRHLRYAALLKALQELYQDETSYAHLKAWAETEYIQIVRSLRMPSTIVLNAPPLFVVVPGFSAVAIFGALAPVTPLTFGCVFAVGIVLGVLLRLHTLEVCGPLEKKTHEHEDIERLESLYSQRAGVLPFYAQDLTGWFFRRSTTTAKKFVFALFALILGGAALYANNTVSELKRSMTINHWAIATLQNPQAQSKSAETLQSVLATTKQEDWVRLYITRDPKKVGDNCVVILAKESVQGVTDMTVACLPGGYSGTAGERTSVLRALKLAGTAAFHQSPKNLD